MSRSCIITILIILCGVAYVIWPRPEIKTDGTPASEAFREVSNFRTALSMFEIDCGRCPTMAEGLGALLKRPPALPEGAKWHGPYLDVKELPKDPWGHDYVYRCPGRHNPDGFDVYSLGPNGKGGDEAIGNFPNR